MKGEIEMKEKEWTIMGKNVGINTEWEEIDNIVGTEDDVLYLLDEYAMAFGRNWVLDYGTWDEDEDEEDEDEE